MKTKRDEWSCPCCGTPTDSSYCAPCDAADCGECDYRDRSGVCAAEWERRGWRRDGSVTEPHTLKSGEVRVCRIEVWRKPDGYTYGRVLEVLA